uniref:Putative ATPase domain containing protein n=1 Tax=viral metagenome TaxID=1070528 RepID=A0A6H1ZFW2_9ZZZZ
MKIISLEVQNVKRIKAVRIEPDGNLIIIGGDNGQGKTSVLDSITYALAGKSAQPSKPVRDGEEKATTEIDLGDFVVKRTITASGGGTLTVTAANGARFASPQSMLDKLVGKLSFDPLEFSRMRPAEQAKVLRDLVGLDLSGLDTERQQAYDARTEVNRDVKRLRSQFESMPEGDPTAEGVSVSALADELEAVRERNRERIAINEAILATERDREEVLAKIEELKERAALMANEIKALDVEAQKAGNKEPTEEIVSKIKGAEEINRAVDAAFERKKVLHELKKSDVRSEELTERIEEIDAKKESAIAAASFPVSGLGVSDDGVTYNGIPFEQASSAEQLRVSVAIGLALNPDLKVLLVRDGSLLDSTNLGMVRKMAEDADAQVWIERVGKTGEVSVVIEDGEVA